VTHRENVRRGLGPSVAGEWQRKKTHCLKGHPYSGTNLAIRLNGHRRCKQCEKEYTRRWRNKVTRA